MKIRHKAGTLEVEVEGSDVKECFDSLAHATEVFSQTRCGACDNTEVRFIVRENKGFTFREVQCIECNASLAFGVRKSDGALYPRRKDEDGNWLENRGWVKFQSNQSSRDQQKDPW